MYLVTKDREFSDVTAPYLYLKQGDVSCMAPMATGHAMQSHTGVHPIEFLDLDF